jgi:Holliday junction resolvase
MHKFVYCVIEEIVNFIKENRIKFIKIKNAKNRNGKPKSQYKCEDWMTRELYFRFCDIFHLVEPEPRLRSRKRFDIFIENDKEYLWIEAKERFKAGGNKGYLGDLEKAINELIKNDECEKLLFFSTYNEPIDNIIENLANLAKKLEEKFGVEPKNSENIIKEIKEKKYTTIKIEDKERNKIIEIKLEIRGKEIRLCDTKTLYLHFYIFEKLSNSKVNYLPIGYLKNSKISSQKEKK